MGLSKSRKEIEKKLIIDGQVEWEYLLDLREIDREQRTSNYIDAKNILKDRGIITTEPRGNFFIYDPSGYHIEPRLSIGYSAYFTNKADAEAFARILSPRGLVARVE